MATAPPYQNRAAAFIGMRPGAIVSPGGGRVMGALWTFGWEWGSALLRWLHVIAASAWIGGSFFFMHLDASLRKKAGDDPALKGTSWQVHGGGFYQMKKYLVGPAGRPETA